MSKQQRVMGSRVATRSRSPLPRGPRPRRRSARAVAPRARRTHGTVIALALAALVGGTAVVGAVALDGTRGDAGPASGADRLDTSMIEHSSVSRGGQRDDLSEVEETIDEVADSAAAEEKALKNARAAKRLVEAQEDPHPIARRLIADHGWGEGEFDCLVDLWNGESAWQWDATNPTSGAYGIPQALPAEKMEITGNDWRTNPVTQIRWGLTYIESRYGTPCVANTFKVGHNWY